MADEQSELAAARARVAELEARARETEAGSDARPVARSGTGGSGARHPIWIIGGVALVGALFALDRCVNGAPPPVQPEANANWKAEAEALKPIGVDGGVAMPPESLWRYGVLPDPIRGKAGATACVRSTDQVRLDFPYQSQNTELCIRRSPRHGLDVYLSLPEGGQYICRSYDGCSVQVRFDDATAISFPAVDAADGSSDIIFIRRAEAFLAKVKTAKVTRIEALYYRAGSQVSTFSTRDLDAQQLALKTAE